MVRGPNSGLSGHLYGMDRSRSVWKIQYFKYLKAISDLGNLSGSAIDKSISNLRIGNRIENMRRFIQNNESLSEFLSRSHRRTNSFPNSCVHLFEIHLFPISTGQAA